MKTAVLQQLITKKDLSFEESVNIFTAMLSGKLSSEIIAALLTAMAKKGETAEEIAGAAQVMRAESLGISPKVEQLTDTCGTGGDGLQSFNVSTTSAFVVAGAGIPVAKHGNRSISSRSGSADVLEALGISLDISAKRVEQAIEELGIGFLFAPAFHPGMKFVQPVRKKLGIRTIFNILGPLANPANAKYQVIGVFRKDLCKTLAEALQKIGVKRALVVHGSDGMDEITLTGKTFFAVLKREHIELGEINPLEYGFSFCSPQDLQGGDAEENAQILLNILKDTATEPQKNIVLLNAGAALWIGGAASNLQEGIAMAQESIENGKALRKLESLQGFLR